MNTSILHKLLLMAGVPPTLISTVPASATNIVVPW